VRSAILKTACLLALACAPAQWARAQTVAAEQPPQEGVRPSEAVVPLAQAAVALDAVGRQALGGRLRTQSLAGTPEAPVRNTRIVIENRSTLFYNYVSGWATFYGEDGVRCGEGLWKLEALAPSEQVEVDTPGLRLTCAPASWRIVATTLLTRTADVAKPAQGAAPQPETGAPAAAMTTTTEPTPAIPPLEINVNGKTIPIQLGNPLEVIVGKERVRIILQPAP